MAYHEKCTKYNFNVICFYPTLNWFERRFEQMVTWSGHEAKYNL